MSRVFQHLNNPDMNVVFISAFTSPEILMKLQDLQSVPSEQETLGFNLKRHQDLKKDLVEKRVGIVELDSGWIYEDDTGKERTQEEQSFMAPNIEKGYAISLCKKYHQQCIMMKDDSGLYLINPDGTTGFQIVGKGHGVTLSFKPEDIKKGFSALIRANHNQRGVKFSFVQDRDQAKKPMSIPEMLIGLEFGRIPKYKTKKRQ